MTRDGGIDARPAGGPHGRKRTGGPARWDPVLSADEEHELAGRIKQGDQAARRRLILANLRLVVMIARRFRTGKLSLDDLVQEGNLGLMRATQDFDPSLHGCRFATYAEIWIKSFIHRALIANESLIRVPQHAFLLRRRHRRSLGVPAGAGTDGDTTLGRRAPEKQEVARFNGLPAGQADPAEVGRREAASGGDRGVEVVPLTEAIADRHRPDREVAECEQRVLLEVALRRLNPVEAWVIRERYGLCLLIPDPRNWSSPAPPADPDVPDAGLEGHPPARRPYFHRSYVDLERDCGLSGHRIRQVEQAALEKLGEVLRPCLADA